MIASTHRLLAIFFISLTCASCSKGSSSGGTQTTQTSTSAINVRNIFPHFIYATANDNSAFNTAASLWGIQASQYMDIVLSDLRTRGFDVIWLNNIDYSTMLPQWLGKASQYGLKVIAQGSGPASLAPYWDQTQWPWPSNWQGIVDNEVKPFWQSNGPRFASDNTLIMHILSEELPNQQEIFTKANEVITVIRSADPNHPVVFEYNNVDTVVMAIQAMNPPLIIWGEGPFQNTSSDDNTRYFFSLFKEKVYQVAKAINAPMWVLTQGNNLEIYQNGVLQPTHQNGARRPTRAQMRWLVWSSLFHGAKGIGYFLHWWQDTVSGSGYEELLYGMLTRQGQTTDIYEEATSVNSSINSIKSLLLRLEAEESFASETHSYWQTTSMIRTRTFRHLDTAQRYLMMVNYDFVNSQNGLFPSNLGGTQLTDVRSGQVWTISTIGSLTLQPGDGTLFRID